MNDTAEPSPENRGKSLICALSAIRSLNWKEAIFSERGMARVAAKHWRILTGELQESA